MNPSVNVIIFNLNFCQIFFSIIFIKIEHIDLENQKVFNLNQIDELIMKGVMNYCLNIFIIYSLVYNSFLNTIVFFYLSPIILSYIYLKQKMDNIKKIEKKNYLLALLVCIIFFIKNFKGTFFSIFSSILLALNQLIDPKTCNNYHPYIINFISNAIGLIITPILMSINNDLFTIGYCENLLFLILSFCSFYSFYFKQKSFQFNQNIYRSNINYISIILGYFYSFFILKEKIDILIVIGCIMIIVINYYSNITIAENEDDK
jgi:drug/metabolite transporter (DMT)-like permease